MFQVRTRLWYSLCVVSFSLAEQIFSLTAYKNRDNAIKVRHLQRLIIYCNLLAARLATACIY